ncbi:hypothetical protein KI387_025232, partial [Taxus chinensis]
IISWINLTFGKGNGRLATGKRIKLNGGIDSQISRNKVNSGNNKKIFGNDCTEAQTGSGINAMTYAAKDPTLNASHVDHRSIDDNEAEAGQ